MSYQIIVNKEKNSFYRKSIPHNFFNNTFQNRFLLKTGYFSDIFQVEKESSKYVIKRLKKPLIDEYEFSLQCQEIKALSLVKDSPFCISIYNSWVEENHLHIQMEFCKKISDSTDFEKLLNEVLNGLNDLHSKGFVHRDIKQDNIMMGLDGNYKIIDFGMAAETNLKELYQEDLRQTALMVRELIANKEVDQSLFARIENMLINYPIK